MYNIRTFTADGVETNKELGKEYKVYTFEGSPIPFKEKHGEIFGVPEAGKPFKPEAKVLIVGDIVEVLYSGWSAYIVSDNGKTYAKVSDR